MLTAISAHRRDEAGLDGLREAVASGADYVELDVRRTGDGVLVVHHDPAVSGLPLSRISLDRLREAAERPIATVPEALKIISGRARLHLDFKERGVEHETVELALASFAPQDMVVTTREATSLIAVKKAYPQVQTALSVGRGLLERGALGDFAPIRALRAAGVDMVALNHRLARVGVLAQCARAGFPAMIWTVNGEPQMRRFLRDPRVAVLITDHPETALRLRARSA